MSRNWINFLLGLFIIFFAVLNLPLPLWIDRILLILSGLVIAILSFNLLNKEREGRHGHNDNIESE